MRAWDDRSPEAAALLNPALMAVITANAAWQYERASGQPMPWPLAFLVAPLILHKGTRESLPRTTRTHLSTWIGDHPVIRAGFPERARSLTGHVREGLRFGMAHGALLVTDHGALYGRLPNTAKPVQGGDAAHIVQSAGKVGTWFSRAEQPATLFALFGVAP
ncbi:MULTISPECIES: three component ABC system middle component [unclassified Spirillospora]|uniref:three component ABC system middle component n=1 Tax=unclassified Spirillospora TaxID=2642701 RepID=UPI0037202679